ncbi:MAG: alpha/beta hydrolase family protein [Candidatus Binataceae bacterium]
MDIAGAPPDSALARTRSRRAPSRVTTIAGLILGLLAAVALTACKPGATPRKLDLKPFSFQIKVEQSQYQIEGYLALALAPGELPALLILNGDKGDARACIERDGQFTTMAIQVACISLPGYGHSSGPSRFVGPPSVAAARYALDRLAARPDVDANRLALWGLGNGAVAAGLVMDSDTRPRAVILESGAYDMLKLWPEASLRTKLWILRQVWPSKRVLKERSVIANMPRKLDVSVLILHGERDRKMPVEQAERLAEVLRQRGAHVETYYFPHGHELGPRVDGPLRHFLRANLVAIPTHEADSPD